MLELRDAGWTATVDRDPFGEILLSGLAVVAVFLVADHGTTPAWLLLDPGLSAMCFAVAFQRIRQARLVEVASSSAWDEVATVWGPRQRRIDEGLEGPYLLSLHLLPFASLSVVVFLPVLLVGELATLGHQQLFLRSHADYHRRWGYHDGAPEDRAQRLFRWRRAAVARRAGLAALGTVLVVVAGLPTVAMAAVVLAALLVELFVVEPVRSPLAEDRPRADLRIQRVEDAAQVPTNELSRLACILGETLGEQAPTAGDLLARAGNMGHELLVARLGDDPVGLLAFQRRRTAAYLWWLAVDPRTQRRGIGSALLRTAWTHLEDAPLVLMESDVSAGDGGLAAARRGVLGHLGARAISGLWWPSPDGRERYHVFAVEPFGEVSDAYLRRGLREMAQFSLRDAPELREAAIARVAASPLIRRDG